ncbi:MAG: DUF6785 family protein [Armatimonadota bacterium]
MTFRALAIGLLWSVAQSAVMPYNEAVVRGTSLTGNHLPACSMIVLLILVLGVNVIWRWVRPGTELKPAELAVVWIMSSVGANIPFRGFVGFIIPLVATPHYMATPENKWDDLILSHLRPWTIVSDEEASVLFFEGIGRGTFDWTAWAAPVAYWTVFALALYVGTICLSVLFRRQWTEHEKFSFPLVQAPMEMMRPPGHGKLLNSLLRNRLLCVGVAVPLLFHLVNGLHAHFPSVPQLQNRFLWYEGFKGRPWRVLGWWPQLIFSFYFSVVGIAYVIPSEISFSYWFFYLFFKFEYLTIDTFGWNAHAWRCAGRQAFGSQMVIAGSLLWTARRHLKSLVLGVLGRSDPEDRDEPLPYRTALVGSALAFVGTTWMLVHAGVSLWVAVGVMLLWVPTTFCLTWMVINGGMYLVQTPYYLSEMLILFVGSERVGPSNLAILRLPERSLMRDWGEILMPHVLQGFRIGDETGLRRRSLVPIMAVSILVALAVAIPVTIWLGHVEGAVSTLYGGPWFSYNIYNEVANWTRQPLSIDWTEICNAIGGAIFTHLLLAARWRYAGFLLHPIGFAVGASYSNFHIWSSLLVGWLVKTAIMHCGGIRWYRRCRPLFMGLIVGEYMAALIWIVVGAITRVPYRLLPVP